MDSNDSSNEDFVQKSDKTLTDINNDCFAEICKYLDFASQFSLLRTCKTLFDKIVHGVWTPYHKIGFNMDTDESVTKKRKQYQIGFLSLILKNFSTVYNINVGIFKVYLSSIRTKCLPNVTSLSIIYDEPEFKEGKLVKLVDFCRFPNLQHLELDHVRLDLKDKIYPYHRIAFIRDVLKTCNILNGFLKLNIDRDENKVVVLSYDNPIALRYTTVECKYRLNMRQVTFSSDYAQYTESWLDYTEPCAGFSFMNKEFYAKLMRSYYREVLKSTFECPANVESVVNKYIARPDITQWYTKKRWDEPPLYRKSVLAKLWEKLTFNSDKTIKYYEVMRMEHLKGFMKEISRERKVKYA